MLHAWRLSRWCLCDSLRSHRVGSYLWVIVTVRRDSARHTPFLATLNRLQALKRRGAAELRKAWWNTEDHNGTQLITFPNSFREKTEVSSAVFDAS